MSLLTTLSYIMAVVETATLIATLVYVTRAMHEKKNQRVKQGKKGGKNSEVAQKAIAACYRKASIFFMLYLVLNFLRRYSGLFE